MPDLVYLYVCHIKRLGAFQHKCLRHTLGIHWMEHIPNSTVLEKTQSMRVEVLTRGYWFRWLVLLGCTKDLRLPKRAQFGELEEGKRKQCEPKQRWKDCLIKELQMEEPSWYMRNVRKGIYGGVLLRKV